MSTNWSNLIYDVKQQIIGLLDYESRCNLRICSKSDKIHVDSVKFIASKFEIREIDSENDYEKTHIRVDIDNFTIWFIGKSKFTKVDRRWNGELQSDLEEIKTELRFDVAKRYIDKFMVKGGVLAANRFRIEDIKLTPLKNWRIECQEMVFSFTPSANRWLRQSSPTLHKLDIYGNFHGELGSLPQLRNTRDSLVVRAGFDDVSITDELLKSVSTPNLLLESRSFTVEAMKMALDRFLRIGNKDDSLNINGPHLERGDLVVKALLEGLERSGKIQDGEEFTLKITGGFTNAHGVQEPRELYCCFNGRTTFFSCSLWKDFKKHYVLHPFTRKDRDCIGFSRLG